MAIGFLVAVLFLAGISVVAYVNTTQLLNRQRNLGREYTALAHIETLLPTLREADAARAAYVADGDEERRNRFLTCETILRARLHSLPNEVNSGPQREQIARMRPLVERYLTVLHSIVEERAAGHPDTLRALQKQMDASDLPRQVSRETAKLQDMALRRLERLNQGMEDSARESQNFLILRTFGGVAVLSLTFLGFLRYAARQQRQQKELRDANYTLASLAQIDPLTGLNNRRAFNEQLEVEWEQARKRHTGLSLLLLDLDDFKSYNDNYGHLAGDDVLKGAAYILQRRARGSDFTCRYGGEEFAIVLPRAGAAEATVVAERIRAAFETARWPHRAVTISIGIATFTPDIHTAEEFIHEADNALYHAKRSGRNCVASGDFVRR
jgi:diguanylate cyclase (GGDEF)-like protein